MNKVYPVNNCPECGKPAVKTCMCERKDSTCENGHQWHFCTVHHVGVLKVSNHATPVSVCTCGKDNEN